jgi:cytochrome c-type biogenesis protein CcmE
VARKATPFPTTRPRTGSPPARLIVALSVAAALAVFLIYTSFAGGATPSIQPSELAEHDGRVVLGGIVTGPARGDARGDGLRFTLRNVEGEGRVAVLYRGSVPDLFRPGREVMLEGQLRNGTFIAKPDSLKTKCPSKYAPED